MKVVTQTKYFDFSLFVLDLRQLGENVVEFTICYCAIRIGTFFVYLPHVGYIVGLGRLFHIYADLLKINKVEGEDPKTKKKYNVAIFTVVDLMVSVLGLCVRPLSISVQKVQEVAEKPVTPESVKDAPTPDVEIKKEEEKPLEIPKK